MFLVTCVKVRSFVTSECMSVPFGGLSFNSFVQITASTKETKQCGAIECCEGVGATLMG